MDRKILVIAGASGVGKTTVASYMLSEFTEFGFVRSITTRAPRKDAHDDEYIYTDREDFFKRVDTGELMEYMEYGGNMYGTPISELERIFREGKTPLLILDIDGVKALRSKIFDFQPVIVYLWEDINIIEKRLFARDLLVSTEEKMISFMKRNEMNRKDYLAMNVLFSLFDGFVKNEEVEMCALSIKAVFDSISLGESRSVENNQKVAATLVEMAKQK